MTLRGTGSVRARPRLFHFPTHITISPVSIGLKSKAERQDNRGVLQQHNGY